MKRMILKVVLWLVLGHLLFGALLLVVNAVHHGVDDQHFSFALYLLFYYLNYPGVWLLKCMGIDWYLVPLIIAGLVQWIVIGGVVGGAIGLFRKTKDGVS